MLEGALRCPLLTIQLFLKYFLFDFQYFNDYRPITIHYRDFTDKILSQ